MEEKESTEDTLKEIGKLQEEIKRLREDIDESYYRVPKQEFENITVQKITHEVVDQVNKKINSLRNWVGIALLILSFFGFTQWSNLTEGFQEDIKIIKTEINSSIDNKFSAKMNEIDDKLEKTLNFIDKDRDKLRESLDKELMRISRNIDDIVSERIAAKQVMERQIKLVRDDVQSSRKFTLKSQLNALRSDIRSGKLSYKDALVMLNPWLQEVLGLNDKELANDFLDELFRLTYQMTLYEELDRLRVKYEKDFDFKETVWANITIGDMILYEESFSPIYKERALSAYKNALEQSPSYGLPHAVRLLIHMIDYKREKDQVAKESEKSEARNLINIVNSGSHPLTAYEAYAYLHAAIGTKLDIYAKMLFENFVEDLELMRERYEEYKILLEVTAAKGN